MMDLKLDQIVTLAIVSVFGLLTTWLTLRNPRILARMTSDASAAAIKAADDRADVIRKQLKEDTEAAREEVRKTAEALLTTNQRVSEDQAEIKSQLVGIHGLVNSNLTESKQANLSVLRLYKASLIGPPDDPDAAIKLADSQITALENELKERAATTNAMELQAAVSATSRLASASKT